MNDRTKLGLGVLEAALLLGLLGNALLRVTPWGINAFLAVVALVVAMLALLRQRRGANVLSNGGRLLIGFVCVFAAAFAWRDSPTLKFLNVLSITVALALIALDTRTGRVRFAGVTNYLLGILLACFNSAFGALQLLLSDIKWGEIPRGRWSRQAGAIARGLFIAVPLLFVFGLLFMAADAVFNDLVNRSFSFDGGEITTHVFLTALFAWLSAGFLSGMVLGNDLTTTSFQSPGLQTLDVAGQSAPKIQQDENTQPANAPSVTENENPAIENSLPKDESSEVKNENNASQPKNRFLSLGIIEIGVVLGLLNALFFSFVLVQMRYLFGGGAHVLASSGLTYAEYARRGFFELVWVAALTLPLLLAAHWLLRKENPAHERIFRVLAGTLVVLLFVVMLSALQRMRLYQSEYGLTELRLYTTAFMGWLGIVFVWFTATILTGRGRREQFAFGAVIAAFVIVVGLHVVNPDALIVRTNAGRVMARGVFDDEYAVSLSADAVPSLIAAMPQMTVNDRRSVATRLLRDWSPSSPQVDDWRTWSWSRHRARGAIRENEAMLNEFAREEAHAGCFFHQ